MGFPRQEYWSGWPFPSPGNLPDPGIKPMSPAFTGGLFTTEPPGKPPGGCRAVIFGSIGIRYRLEDAPSVVRLAPGNA